MGAMHLDVALRWFGCLAPLHRTEEEEELRRWSTNYYTEVTYMSNIFLKSAEHFVLVLYRHENCCVCVTREVLFEKQPSVKCHIEEKWMQAGENSARVLLVWFIFFFFSSGLRRLRGSGWDTSSVGFHCPCHFFCRSFSLISVIWRCQKHWKVLSSSPQCTVRIQRHTLPTQINTETHLQWCWSLTNLQLRQSKSRVKQVDKNTVRKYDWIEV